MKRVTTALSGLARDFTLFWHIRVPAWLSRLAASLPTSRNTQDLALYACALVAVGLISSGAIG